MGPTRNACGELDDSELVVRRVGCHELDGGELGGGEMYRTLSAHVYVRVTVYGCACRL